MPPTYTHTYDATAQGDALLRNEWLLTNGTGAFSAGTALGANTRRYHGLLIAATAPPVGRVVLLNQCFEQLVLTARNEAGEPVEQVIELSTMLFAGDDGQAMLVPDGHQRLARFDKGLSTQWTYRWAGVEITRELFLHWKQQAATLRYTVAGLDSLPAGACERATLRVAPMTTLRDFHGTLQKDWAGPIDVQRKVGAGGGPVVTASRDGVTATFAGSAGQFVHEPDWWFGLHYPIDQRRGQDAHEDYFLPGRFEISLDAQGQTAATLTVALGDSAATPDPTTTARATHLAKSDAGLDPAHAQAADDFVVDRTVRGQTLSTILAGYPWFADWGRDTFIALPGLLLTTGRFDEARATLRAFAQAIGTDPHEGLVPNRFDDYDDNAAHYNTVDGSLWFIHAALEYLDASGDTASWEQWLAPACVRIANAYAQGTAFGIGMDRDGLIAAGSWDTQLTWMDAAAVPPGSNELHVFTPRPGKCVEINALWFNAVAGLAEHLPKAHADDAQRFADIAKQAKRSFTPAFWNPDTGCLFDHVFIGHDGQTHKDGSIRPNQCLAVSLPRSPLPKAKQQSVIRVVGQTLLTPAGLRTLSEDHPNFHPWYAGIQYDRDKAYHQGTIWPWLIGPYAEGVLRAGGFTKQAKQEAAAAIAPLLAFMQDRGVGQLYEIHQAEPVEAQHPPRGCFAQAWSVAEVIRVLGLLRDH